MEQKIVIFDEYRVTHFLIEEQNSQFGSSKARISFYYQDKYKGAISFLHKEDSHIEGTGRFYKPSEDLVFIVYAAGSRYHDILDLLRNESSRTLLFWVDENKNIQTARLSTNLEPVGEGE